jgi:acetyl esterase
MDRQETAPQLDPQLVAATRVAAEMQQQLGPPGPGVEGARRHAEQARRWWNEGGPAMAREIETQVPVRGGSIDAVVYVPSESRTLRPCCVYLHGGGFKIGGPRSNDRMMRELAASWGGIVASVDYAHLPEHVFPTAVEQTAQVYEWVHRNGAAWGADGNRLAFGGTSSGASISLGAAVHLGQAGSSFLRAGVLLVGFYDRDFETESMRLYGGGDLFPNLAGVQETLDEYVPDPAVRADPRVSSVDADPRLLPPLFIGAAEIDVFRDSSRRLAQVMKQAGRPHRFIEYPGMTHLFGGYSRMVDTSARCIQDMADFLRSHVR